MASFSSQERCCSKAKVVAAFPWFFFDVDETGHVSSLTFHLFLKGFSIWIPFLLILELYQPHLKPVRCALHG